MNNKNFKNIGIAFFLLMVLLPFAAGLIYSLLYAFGLAGILSKGFTLTYAEKVFNDGEAFMSLLYSFCIAAISIVVSLSISIAGVLLFKTKIIKGRQSFFTYLPLALPAIVTAFFSFQLLGKSGWLSRVAYNAHAISDLQQFPDLINDHYAIGIILTHILMAVPFFLIFFSNLYHAEELAALSNVSFSLGATIQQTAIKIVLPVLLKKGFRTILLYFIFVFGSYEIPLILGSQSPQMISVLIVRKMQRFNLLDIPQGYFLSFLYSVIVTIVLLLFLHFKKENALWV